MADLKRRPLGGNRQQQPQNKRNQPQKQNQNQRQQRPNQGAPQQQRAPQRQNPRPAPPPPPPPPFMQRDILLMASGASTAGIEEVRAKLDPLAKKIPAHVTLLSPEPSKGLSAEILKTTQRENLPSLGSLNFTQINIHDDMYLWLLPDEESKQKIIEWRKALLDKLAGLNPNHTQESEEFLPRITLGYIPRSLTPEDALAFAKNLIPLPLTINFEKFLLEEFSENQVSTQIDALIIT